MLKHISNLSLIILFLISSACSSVSMLSKQSNQAQIAFNKGEYQTAYSLYKNLIDEQVSKNKIVDGAIYGAAAKAALKANKFVEGESYFKQAVYKEYGDADLYADIQKVYLNIDNLSKEIDVLEYFVLHFKEDLRFKELNKRLFETYVESENWDKALKMWSSFDADSKVNGPLLELYLIALDNSNNEVDAEEIATKLLKIDVTNKKALEWKASKYFWKAEKRYQKELENYEKNKTNAQYKKMLVGLDAVTRDFQKALKYYQMLYKMDPLKEYAKSISNIYGRFQDKKKSDYYLKLSK